MEDDKKSSEYEGDHENSSSSESEVNFDQQRKDKLHKLKGVLLSDVHFTDTQHEVLLEIQKIQDSCDSLNIPILLEKFFTAKEDPNIR
jgi:hypothetical protein